MVVLLDTLCVFICVWGPLKLISAEMLVGLLTETIWRQHCEQLTLILNICYIFSDFCLRPWILQLRISSLVTSVIQLSLSQQKLRAVTTWHYSQLQISLIVYLSLMVMVSHLCLRGRAIFEKLSSKDNSSLFLAKGVSKIKIIIIKAGPFYMKFLIACDLQIEIKVQITPVFFLFGWGFL